ncbi:hypothetical protein BDV06DRAFT_130011 [Aspergillus oleicola]
MCFCFFMLPIGLLWYLPLQLSLSRKRLTSNLQQALTIAYCVLYLMPAPPIPAVARPAPLFSPPIPLPVVLISRVWTTTGLPEWGGGSALDKYIQ